MKALPVRFIDSDGRLFVEGPDGQEQELVLAVRGGALVALRPRPDEGVDQDGAAVVPVNMSRGVDQA